MQERSIVSEPSALPRCAFICAFCGKAFQDSKHLIRIYCSRTCATEVNSRRPVTPETRQKVGAAHKGLKHGDESKGKMSQAKLGRPLSEAHRQRIGEGNQGRLVSEETRRKITEGLKRTNLSEATRAKRRMAGLNISDTHRRILSDIHMGNTLFLGRHHSEATKQKMREAALARLDDPEYSARWHAAVHRGISVRPTKPEQLVLVALDKMFPGEWRYTGDASLLVGGRSPDFASTTTRKLIEVYGDYWHRGEDPSVRIEFFRQFGYETMVVWEREVYGCPATLAQRLLAFHRS